MTAMFCMQSDFNEGRMMNKTQKSPRVSIRSGFTLIELLVVISIIGMLTSMLLPAVQKARESGRRTQCLNNLHQIGLAIQLHAEQRNALPTSGAGMDSSGADTFALQSTLTTLLPFLESSTVHDRFKLQYAYNDNTNAPTNQQTARTVFPFFLCPSNTERPMDGRDSLGYGYTDYFTIAYVDIDANAPPGQPINDPAPPNKVPGAFRVAGTTPAHYRDGMSSTIVFMEMSGRGEDYYSAKHDDPIGFGLPPGNIKRASWRWAEPASAAGVSGPANGVFGDDNLRMINNNASPVGGTGSCPWFTTNCGPNDEPFSFHNGMSNTLFMDGHVSQLRGSIDPIVLRRLLTPLEGLPPADINGNSFSDY